MKNWAIQTLIQCRRAFLWLTLTKAAWDYLVVPLLLWLTPIEGWNAVILWEVQPAIGSVVLLFYAGRFIKTIRSLARHESTTLAAWGLIPVTFIPFVGVAAYAWYYTRARARLGDPVGAAPRQFPQRQCRCGSVMEAHSGLQWNRPRINLEQRAYAGYELFYRCHGCGTMAEIHSALMMIRYAAAAVVCGAISFALGTDLAAHKAESPGNTAWLLVGGCAALWGFILGASKTIRGIRGRMRTRLVRSPSI